MEAVKRQFGCYAAVLIGGALLVHFVNGLVIEWKSL
jgi:hypothetical protein